MTCGIERFFVSFSCRVKSKVVSKTVYLKKKKQREMCTVLIPCTVLVPDTVCRLGILLQAKLPSKSRILRVQKRTECSAPHLNSYRASASTWTSVKERPTTALWRVPGTCSILSCVLSRVLSYARTIGQITVQWLLSAVSCLNRPAKLCVLYFNIRDHVYEVLVTKYSFQ